jgi:serine/threonine protein kinase
MDLSVPNVYGLLIRSRLLSLDEARAMFARWNEEAQDGANNLARFASWMVSNQYLTEYQAGLLARGHADGFFLNEYKVLDRIGKGRMAGVYKAQHPLGQIVAVKVLPPSRAQDPHLLKRFRREARLALRLQHHNIVRAFQTGTADGLPYLVMEYLEGETLEEVLQRRKKLPPAEAVRIVYQALLGLQHIHEQQLVHRDLKPANLMLVRAPEGATGKPAAEGTLNLAVKILDIGLGRALLEEAAPAGDHSASITAVGVLLGTPDYMSPEQARDPHTIDIRSDIYSLGCVLYHCLAGSPPFPDTNIISQMIRHASEAPRPLREHSPEVPEGLQQIVDWMLAKEPDKRYPTPERAAAALEVFLAAGTAPKAPEPDAKMRSFLTWLEKEDAANHDKPEPSSAPAPGPPPLPTANGDRSSSAEKPRPKQRKPRRARPPTPPPLVDPEVNVELVPLPPPDFPQEAGREPARGLTRRDFIAFGIGAAAGALATFLGCLVALVSVIRGRREPEPPNNPAPPKEESP